MKILLKVLMTIFGMSVMTVVAFAGTTPEVMHVGCAAPNPDTQSGLQRPKGDSDAWTFAIALDGDARFVTGPYWTYPGKGGGDPDWGLWTGGADGESSLGWSSPGRTGSFSVRVSGKIACGDGGGDGQPIDFEAGWDGEVVATQVEIASITFGGGNFTLKQDNGTFVFEGGANVRTPEILKKENTGIGTEPFIVPEYEVSSPVSYSWESSPVLNVAINTSDNDEVTARIKAIASVGNVNLTYAEKSVELSGDSTNLSFTTSDKLAKTIVNNNISIAWTVSLDNGATYYSQSPYICDCWSAYRAGYNR